MSDPIIYRYTRAQAIADGVLIDLSEADAVREIGLRVPVVITAHAYADTISAGGRWVPDGAGSESLQLPGGQSHDGRLWDVLSLLRHAMRKAAPGEDTVWFSVLVDVHGNVIGIAGKSVGKVKKDGVVEDEVLSPGSLNPSIANGILSANGSSMPSGWKAFPRSKFI